MRLTRIDENTGDPFLPRATFALLCSVCDAVSVRFGVDGAETRMLVFDRSTQPHQAEVFSGETSPELVQHLEHLDADALIEKVNQSLLPPGCEAYCASCAKLYCYDHFQFESPEWGEYVAVCPEGHRYELH